MWRNGRRWNGALLDLGQGPREDQHASEVVCKVVLEGEGQPSSLHVHQIKEDSLDSFIPAASSSRSRYSSPPPTPLTPPCLICTQSQ